MWTRRRNEYDRGRVSLDSNARPQRGHLAIPTEIVPDLGAYRVILSAARGDQSYSDVIGEADTMRGAREILAAQFLMAKAIKGTSGFYMRPGGAEMKWEQNGWTHTAYIVRMID